VYRKLERPLRDEERRWLQSAISRRPRLLAPRRVAAGLVGCGALGGLTLLAWSHDSRNIPFAWTVLFRGGMLWIMLAWTWWDDRRAHARQWGRSARTGDGAGAVEHAVAATGAVKVMGPDDEAWFWALQVEPDRLLLWPETWEEPEPFPVAEVRLAQIVDAAGEVRRETVEAVGQPLPVSRTISGEHLRWPDGIELLPGRLEDLEQLLRRK